MTPTSQMRSSVAEEAIAAWQQGSLIIRWFMNTLSRGRGGHPLTALNPDVFSAALRWWVAVKDCTRWPAAEGAQGHQASWAGWEYLNNQGYIFNPEELLSMSGHNDVRVCTGS